MIDSTPHQVSLIAVSFLKQLGLWRLVLLATFALGYGHQLFGQYVHHHHCAQAIEDHHGCGHGHDDGHSHDEDHHQENEEESPSHEQNHDHHCCGTIVGNVPHDEQPPFRATASQLKVVSARNLILLPDRRVDRPPQV